MLRTLDRLCIGAKLRMYQFCNNLRKDESGVAAIVATVLLILVVVLLVGIFWDNLKAWFDEIWEKIMKGSNIQTP